MTNAVQEIIWTASVINYVHMYQHVHVDVCTPIQKRKRHQKKTQMCDVRFLIVFDDH